VGSSNTHRTGISTSNVFRTRANSCIPSSECPPSSKKVTVDSDPFYTQQFLPYGGELSFCFIPWRDECVLGEDLVWVNGWQRASIHLAVWKQRKFFHSNEGGRDHIIWSSIFQILFQFRCSGHRVFRADDVSDKLLRFRTWFTDCDNRLAQQRMFVENRLDLAEFNPKAAQFDLIIGSAEIFDSAIGQIPPQVSCFVKAFRPVTSKRVKDKPLSREFRLPAVAAGETVSSCVNLTADADRDRFQIAVENMDLHVVDGPADWNGSCLSEHIYFFPGDVSRNFGRAVEVEKSRVWKRFVESPCQFEWQRFTAGGPEFQIGEAILKIRNLGQQNPEE